MLEFLISDESVSKTDRVAVGVSGGADSMLLLWALIDKQKKVGFFLHVIHVNHGLRGEESERDSKFVKDFCKRKKIPCTAVSVDVAGLKEQKKLTTEEAAREARYDAIYKVMREEKLNKLFLAHHKNDQAETVLMHLFRGSGVLGMCGMRDSETVKRPFLNMKKSEIVQLANDYSIQFVTDSSNAADICSRNKIRNKILPEIEKIYPSAVDAICNFSEKCEQMQRFIEKEAQKVQILKDKSGAIIPETAFDADAIIVRERVRCAFNLINVVADVEEKHYELVSGLMSQPVNTTIDLPHKTFARRVYEGVRLQKKESKAAQNQNFQFCLGTINFAGYGTITCEAVPAESVIYGDGSLFVDLDKIPSDAVWRIRAVGDKFAKLGSGSKSLSDHFTDQKVEHGLRDRLPVLASKQQVLVVAGDEISDYVKISGDTDSIVKISFKPDK